MARLQHMDILMELVDLCNDLIGDIRQQLVYYRASVYKNETADQIKTKIDHLRFAIGFFADDMLTEPLRDYDAMVENAAILVPGECSFSVRVTRLLNSLEEQLKFLHRKIMAREKVTSLEVNFVQNFKKSRQRLLSLCRYGSRQWSFFQTM